MPFELRFPIFFICQLPYREGERPREKGNELFSVSPPETEVQYLQRRRRRIDCGRGESNGAKPNEEHRPDLFWSRAALSLYVAHGRSFSFA